MTALTFRLEIRRDRVLALWLAVTVLAYGGVIAAMYPVLKENTKALEDYMKVFSKELLAAFGMSGSLTEPGVFFSTYIGSMLWPIVAAIAAVALATRPAAADVDRGWADLALGTPLDRTRYLLASIAAQALVLAVLALATVGGVLVVGRLVGVEFDAGRFLAGGFVLWLFGCAVAGVASLIAAWTLSRGLAAGATTGLLIAMYLLNVLAQLQPDLGWLADLSAFKYLLVTDLIAAGAIPWPAITLFAVVGLVGWTASLLVFRRRDLLA